jgi:hypothetical protein
VATNDDTRDRGYDVGYGKPPRHSRFKPGRSGNRAGRERGSRDWKTILREIATREHWVDENGERKRRSTLELILLVVRNQAAAGNVRAIRAYEDICARHGVQPPPEPKARLILPDNGRYPDPRKIPSDPED